MKNLTEKIQLDFRSRVPIYTQIVEQVKQQVVSEKLKSGDQLLTVRALAQELKVNFNTVARAYRLLDEAGIISTQQGRGTYILEAPTAKRTDKFRKQALKALTHVYLNEALHLGCSPDEISKALKKQISAESQAKKK